MNWKYVLFGVARRRLPETFLFRLMEIRGGVNSAEVTPDTKFAEWDARLAVHGINLENKRVLEIGSGRYARLALRMIVRGARRVTLVDPYAVALDESKHRALLLQDCANLGLEADVLERIQVLRVDFSTHLRSAKDDQVDLVVSTAMLEHARAPQEIFKQCVNWLTAGGMTFHIIDLRDHNLAFQYPFEMLTYSESVWSRWFNLSGGFYLNRWRASDYVNALREAGFVNVSCNSFLSDEHALERTWQRIRPEFRTLGKQELALLGICLYGEKPSEPKANG